MSHRIGFGFDTHALIEGLSFRIGGIDIPFDKGAAGHSDADVLVHAICDALLGASVSGDIGTHFPDTDPQYKGIDSTLLLQEVSRLIYKKGFRIVNIDCTVCLQKPRIAPYIPQMQERLADVMNISADVISVKAKTAEKLGFIGREEGLSAYAVTLLETR
jgi:2-C-methyl-D-erythritol 2,4-cyclodiphosphate synthase